MKFKIEPKASLLVCPSCGSDAVIRGGYVSRELQTITEHYTYDNMALVSLTPLHAAPYKGRLQCTATFQRVNQVKLQTVGREEKKLAPSKSGSPGKTAAAEVNAGTQKAKPVEKGSWMEKALFGKNEAANRPMFPGMPAEVRP